MCLTALPGDQPISDHQAAVIIIMADDIFGEIIFHLRCLFFIKNQRMVHIRKLEGSYVMLKKLGAGYVTPALYMMSQVQR